MTKKPPKNPVSQEHAQKFALAVAFWADVLGMGDWRIVVADKRSTRAAMAEVYKFDMEQRAASIRLGRHFGGIEVTDLELSKTALHEVLHIFLYEYKMFCMTNDSPDDIMSAEHRLINILERRLSDASPFGPQG
jgi:DICT domain-containing protein